MELRDIKLWHVYYAPNCRHILPQPKNKFVVIVCIDGEKLLGFLINSSISNFVRSRPDLLICEVEITAEEHDFLKWNSVIDCHTLYTFYITDFEEERGELSHQAAINVLQAVKDCPTITRKYKQLILDGGSDLLDE